MKKQKAIWGIRLLPVILILAGSALALPPTARATDAVSGLLREHQIGETDEEVILAVFHRAEKESLPLAQLHARLREGLIKRAEPEAIRAALERRVEYLLKAQDLLRATSRPSRRRPVPHGLEVLASALESGLPTETFAGLLLPVRGAVSYRIEAMIEAGEMLHLAGVAPDAVRTFMRDARSRDLERSLTFRAARLWIQHHQEGVAGEDIRRRVWSTDLRSNPGTDCPSGSPRRAPQRNRQGRSHRAAAEG